MSEFVIGARVVKNPETWVPSEFDSWGAGEGVGVVVASPFNSPDPDTVDVVWPGGRCFQRKTELLLAPDDVVTCPRRQEGGPHTIFAHETNADRWVLNRWHIDKAAEAAEAAEFAVKYPTGHRANGMWQWSALPPRTCSYCGGTHPDDAIALLKDGWEADGTGKSYKVYLDPPGSKAASDEYLRAMKAKEPYDHAGRLVRPTPPVKVYFMHFTPEQGDTWNATLTSLAAEKTQNSSSGP